MQPNKEAKGWDRKQSGDGASGGRGGGVFYLKVDSLYTGGWGDELRGRRGWGGGGGGEDNQTEGEGRGEFYR